MKRNVLTLLTTLLLIGLGYHSQAQATTGGKSGGSSASTGAGYTSSDTRPAASNPQSMTIDDEGASRAYMYVPPKASKNRSSSPDGSPATGTAKQPSSAQPKTPAKSRSNSSKSSKKNS